LIGGIRSSGPIQGLIKGLPPMPSFPTPPAAAPTTTTPLSAGEAPDRVHGEQDDEEAQAQSVSGQAYHRQAPGLDETVKVPGGTPADDVPDLVDRMRQMDSSGLIDMSAFAGERNDDDEEGRYGPAAEEE
jgi:hypothetical protein